MPDASNPSSVWIGPLSADRLRAASLARVPTAPGVYLWLRGFELEPECAVDPALFCKSIEDFLAVPLVRSTHVQLRTAEHQDRVTIRSGLIQFAEFTIGGGRLTPMKRTHLAATATRHHDRLMFYELLRHSVGRFGPVLYVGQASDLRHRVHTHVTSGTQLLDLAGRAGIAPAHLLLYCLPLPNQSVETRTLLEQLLTHILIAPLSYRPG